MSKGWMVILAIVAGLIGIGGFLYTRGGAAPTVAPGHVYFYRNPEFVPPSLGISTVFKLYDPNKEEDEKTVMERYTNVYTEGEIFNTLTNLPIQMEPYAVVQPNQLGIIGNYILQPGSYFKIPSKDVTPVNAALVQEENFGILFTPNLENGEYTLLRPGIHRALETSVRYFPSSPQRYRLISSDLLDKTNDPSLDFDACQSALCETTLSGVLTSDPSVRISVDVEVVFQLIFDDDRSLARLYELRNLETIMRTYLSGPIRTDGRSLWGEMTPDEMQTKAGWIKMEELLTTMLTAAVAGQPIEILSVGIRGVEMPKEYQNQQTQGASDEQAIQAAIRNEKLSQSATASASEFIRQQQELNTTHIAEQMAILSQAIGSEDPIVKCALVNVFYPGTCTYPMPVQVNVDQQPQ